MVGHYKFSCALEKCVYCDVVSWSLLCMSIRLSWLIVLFKYSISLLIIIGSFYKILKEECKFIYLPLMLYLFFFHGILSFNIKFMQVSVQFSSVQLLSHVWLFAMLWIAARQASLSVHHQLPEFTQTHVHRVGDAIQPSHPLLSPSPPALLFLLGELNFYHYQMILLLFWNRIL